MNSVTNARRGVQRLFGRSWKLYRLDHGGSRISRSISHSIRAALNNELSPEERAWIDRIESLRTEMNASSRLMTQTDYGAGNPGSNRTQDEMQRGVEVTDTVGHISQAVSKPPFWCCLLFKLIRTTRPTSCVEMGTAVGISSAYEGAALRLNGHGSLVTIEGAASLADIAKNNLNQLRLDTVEVVVGRFQDRLPEVLKTRQPVDYVFVDGHHDEQATLAYFEQILPFLAETALIVFDDIAWSDGMRRAWKAIARDSRVQVAVDLGPVGLCAIDRSMTGREYASIPLD